MRWMRPLLIASIVLNVFLAGAIVGGLWRWGHQPVRGLGWRKQAMATLPPVRAAELRATLRETRSGSLSTIEQARAARADAARAFDAPTFDAAAALAALDRARAADVAVRTRLEQRVVAFAGTLSPDERRVLAEALRRGPLRRGPLRRGPATDRNPPGR